MGTTAAAVILIKEKHIVAAFREAGATSGATATTPAALGIAERLAFIRLRQREILREVRPGWFYLDEPSWAALQRMRRRVLVALALAAVAVALAWFGRG